MCWVLVEVWPLRWLQSSSGDQLYFLSRDLELAALWPCYHQKEKRQGILQNFKLQSDVSKWVCTQLIDLKARLHEAHWEEYFSGHRFWKITEGSFLSGSEISMHRCIRRCTGASLGRRKIKLSSPDFWVHRCTGFWMHRCTGVTTKQNEDIFFLANFFSIIFF